MGNGSRSDMVFQNFEFLRVFLEISPVLSIKIRYGGVLVSSWTPGRGCRSLDLYG